MNFSPKRILIYGFLLFLHLESFGQVLTGHILDYSTAEPLIYASIGVIETTIGTITNEEGNFRLDIKNLPVNSIVKVSMIGYHAQTFSIDQINKQDTIHLERLTYNLPEVIINPESKLRKIGITKFSLGTVCGWGGNDFGKGWEIGTRINLGDSPKRLKSLHIRINKQSFDSSVFRLHLRDIVDSLPKNELLKNNILITITNKTGWATFNLSKYNLVFQGQIALTLEWIKVIGLDMDKLMISKGTNQSFPAVTFNVKQKGGITYTKWGTEAKWSSHSKYSPSIYFSAQ